MKQFAATITTFLGSQRFLYGVVIFFVLESVWVALSSVYPMAFDEDFHVGIIEIYVNQWLPFMAVQPDNADQFGAVFRDPSFLYHWLMSFPYRFVALFTDSQAAVVIVLRMLNVAIMVAGMALMYRFLRQVGTSRAVIHAAFALFALVPIVPLTAGQVNYDSLFIVFIACLALLSFKLHQQFKAHTVGVRTTTAWLVVNMLGCLTKFAFVPFALASVLFLAWHFWRSSRGRLTTPFVALAKSYRKAGRGIKLTLLAGLLLSGGLFFERYGLNALLYQNPLPDCGVVLNDQRCEAYGPWGRNYRLERDKTRPTDPNPIEFTAIWVQSLHYRSFFMVNGPHHHYKNYLPAPLPSATAWAILIFSVLAVVFFWRRTFGGSPFLTYIALSTGVYLGFLWFDNYMQYLETGQPVAMNGRYLLPLLLMLPAVFGKALGIAFSRWEWLKPYVAAAVILLFLQGGGVFSFILRSDATWYWPGGTVTTLNDTARKAIDPFIIQGPKGY